MDDPGFVAKVRQIQSDPNCIQGMLQDPKIMNLLTSLLGMGGAAGRPEDAAAEMGAADTEAVVEEVEVDAPPAPEPAAKPTPEPTPEVSDEVRSIPISTPHLRLRLHLRPRLHLHLCLHPISIPIPSHPPSQSPQAKQAAEQKQLGNAAYKKRDFDTALRCYEKAQELDPTNAVYWLNSAAVKMETKSYEECIADCKKAIEVCQEFNGAFETMGKAYGRIGTAQARMGLLNEARESYEKSLVESHDRGIEKKLKALKGQIEDQKKKEYLDADKALEHKELGNNLFREGKWTDALKEYR